MPELPEVESIVRLLRRELVGAHIASVAVLRRDFIRSNTRSLPSLLAGRSISAIKREGKRIHVLLEPLGRLQLHLGMTGRVTIELVNKPIEKHTHLCIRFAGRDTELRFRDARRFGGVWYDAKLVAADPLGPDALGIRVPVLRRMCRARRQVKALLMDQRTLAGMGNIYCDEALHAAGIHPATRASELTERNVRNLACSIRKILRAAIAAGGSSLRDYVGADGEPGGFQKLHLVYGRRGEPCTRCGTHIESTVIGSRTTHFCPRCQPHR